MTEYKTKVGYYPPIELHYEEPVWDAMNKAAEEVVANIRNDTDRMVIDACMKVGVSVDKDELVRALRYDRGQYEKGYVDGSLAAAAEVEFFKKRICENGYDYYMHPDNECILADVDDGFPLSLFDGKDVDDWNRRANDGTD